MEITYRRTIYRFDEIEVERLEAVIKLSPASDVEHRIVYTPLVAKDGQVDGLSINGTYFQDLHSEDYFCSEMFAALTGMYPYEWRDLVPVSDW